MPGHVPRKRSITAVFVAVCMAVGSLIVLAASASASETKTFTGQKNCSTAVTTSPPAQGGYCLITASTLKILRGAKVYYTDATVVAGVLRSPVTLRATDERESTATGQCTYFRPAFFPPGHGICTYSSGPGSWPGSMPTCGWGRP